MLPGLATAALVLSALVWELSRAHLAAAFARARARVRGRGIFPLDAHGWASDRTHEPDYDPGRERRAEQRARELLRSCVNEHEWMMYRDLGFLRVFGRSDERYAYLIYPHKPIVAYVPRTGVLLSEYCVAFPDYSPPVDVGRHACSSEPGGDLPAAPTPRSAGTAVSTEPGGHSSATEAGHSPSTGAGGQAPSMRIPVPTSIPRSANIPASSDILAWTGSTRLPDSDDVLAKWMALIADERGLIAEANMHLPGRQVDPMRVRRDLARLARWESEHDGIRASRSPGRHRNVPAGVGHERRAAWADNVPNRVTLASLTSPNRPAA
jgi:hypothetical protein